MPQHGAGEAVGENHRIVVRKEFSNSGNPMTDNVVQQFARQTPNPVVFIPQKGPGVNRIAQVITVVTLHVKHLPAEVPLADKLPQATRDMGELQIVSRGDFEVFRVRQVNQLLRIAKVQCEGLFYVDVGSRLDTYASQRVVTLRRRSDVHDVRPNLFKQLINFTKGVRNLKALA